MTRYLRFWPMVILTVLSLGLTLSSCSDDDDNDTNPVNSDPPQDNRPTVSDNPNSLAPLQSPDDRVFDDTMPTAGFDTDFDFDLMLHYSNTTNFTIGEDDELESLTELDLYSIEDSRLSLNGVELEIQVENFGIVSPEFTLIGNYIRREGSRLPDSGPDQTEMDGQRTHSFKISDEFGGIDFGVPSLKPMDLGFDFINNDLTQSATQDLVLNWSGDLLISPRDFYLVQIRGNADDNNSWQSRILRERPTFYVFSAEELQNMDVGTSGIFYARVARIRCAEDRLIDLDCLICTSTAAFVEMTLVD